MIIKNILRNSKLVGYVLDDGYNKVYISEDFSRDQSYIDIILATKEYKYSFDGLKRIDKQEMESVDYNTLSEEDQLMVDMESGTSRPIAQLVSSKEVQENRMSKMIEDVDLSGIHRITTKDQLKAFLRLPKIKSDRRHRLNINTFTDIDALFTEDDFRKDPELLKNLRKYLTFTLTEWEMMLDEMKSNGRINEDSSYIDILCEFFKYGYPGFMDTVDRLDILTLTDLDMDQRYKDRLCITDQTGVMSIYPSKGITVRKTRGSYSATNPDELDIGYTSTKLDERIIVVKGITHDIRIDTGLSRLFQKNRTRSILNLPSPRVEILNNVFLEFEDMNLLNNDIRERVYADIKFRVVAKSIAENVKPDGGMSTYDILKLSGMSTYSALRYIITNSEKESDQLALDKETVEEVIDAKLQQLDNLLRIVSIAEDGSLQVDESIDEASFDVEVPTESGNLKLTTEELKMLIGSIMSGELLAGETEMAHAKYEKLNETAIYEFFYVCRSFLGLSADDIIMKVLDAIKNANSDSKFIEVSVADKENRELKLRIVTDKSVILSANIDDKIAITNLEGARLWTWVTEVYTSPSPKPECEKDHVAVKYLAWRYANDKPISYAKQIVDIVQDQMLSKMEEENTEWFRKLKYSFNRIQTAMNREIAGFIFRNYLGQLDYVTKVFDINGLQIEKYCFKHSMKNLYSDLEIRIPKSLMIQASKDVRCYIDSLASMSESLVVNGKVLMSCANASVTESLVTPNKGIRILERGAETLLLPVKGMPIRDSLRKMGCMDHPDFPGNENYRLEDDLSKLLVPEFFDNTGGDECNSIVKIGEQIFNYIFLSMKHKNDKDAKPIGMCNPLARTYPGLYQSKEFTPWDGISEFVGNKFVKPRWLEFNNARKMDVAKKIEMQTYAKISSAIPIEVYDYVTLDDIVDFVKSDGLKIKTVASNSLVTEANTIVMNDSDLDIHIEGLDEVLHVDSLRFGDKMLFNHFSGYIVKEA